MHIQFIQLQLIDSFRSMGLKTTVSVALHCGMTQSTVYRSLYGKPKRLTRSIRSLCNYANMELDRDIPNPAGNMEIMATLRSVWDGTDGQAKHISRLLKHVYTA